MCGTLRIGVMTLLVRLPARATSSCAAAPSGSTRGSTSTSCAEDPAWIGIGFITADAGALLLLISLILGGLGLRRVRGGGGTGLLRASLIISVVLLAAYVVAIWAMGAKPA